MSLAHVTQDKGDAGTAYDRSVTTAGVKIALPLSEHLPFDLIAISNTGALAKVSVKYRTVRDGKLEVLLRSKWNTAQGTRQRRWGKGEVDVHAIYCPDTTKCYFVPDRKVRKSTITLRITPPQAIRSDTMLAEDFENPDEMFK